MTSPLPVTTPSAGNSRSARSGAPVLDPEAELDEGVVVEQQAQPLAGRQLTLLVLARDLLCAAAGLQVRAPRIEFLETFLGRHAVSSCWGHPRGSSRPREVLPVGGPWGCRAQR
jgi:hypothetical protein